MSNPSQSPKPEELNAQYDSPWKALAQERKAREQIEARIQDLENELNRYRILREIVTSVTELDENTVDRLVEERKKEDEQGQ